MKEFLRRFITDESGAAIEYALIGAGLIVTLITIVGTVATDLTQ
jgi:Flp pilus assembly pilin Flp